LNFSGLAIILLCASILLSFPPSLATPEHVDTMVHTAFYGHIPTLPSGAKAATIAVVGLQDSTKVSIYDIGGRQLLVERTINRFEVLEYNVTKELYFKIVTNKPVAAAVTGTDFITPSDNWGSGITLYPSTSGSPIGKEFIIYALQVFHTVYSLESTSIKVYDAKGILIDSFSMPANWSTPLLLTKRALYRIVSSGNIIIARWPQSYGVCTALPDIKTGNLVGKVFIGRPCPSTEVQTMVQIQTPIGAYVIYAYETATVRVYDFVTGELINEHVINKGEYYYNGGAVRTSGEGSSRRILEYVGGAPLKDLLFVSDGLVSIWVGGCHQPTTYEGSLHIASLGDDVWFAGGVNGREFMFFAPSYAILFAPQDVRVNIDGSERSLKADEYVRISSGFHKVTSDKTVIIQIVGLGEALDSWAQYLVSSPEVPASHPELSGGGPDITLIAGGGAVAAIAAIVAVMIIKRRK